MPLTPGTRIGAYEITAPLGAGGMGEVYRAKDSRLKREVALKVLPADVANDRERMARFQREAEVLASLNHPNIAHIHGIEESGGTIALVMELVEGEDLAERLKRGAIPIDEALPIAKQIAEALEAAHEQGIIHRDLKPANIKVRPDGTVKVLDFGLAKALDRSEGDGFSGRQAESEASALQTITSPAMTMRGMILGTAAYMAPEQAKGKAVDRCADIWAFGVVLYEMLAGTRAFKGDDVTDIITAVMRDTPDWTALPLTTPAGIRTLLRRSIEKDPRKRIPHIAVARLEIEDAMMSTGELVDAAAAPGAAAPAGHAPSWWAVAGVLLGLGLVATAIMRDRPVAALPAVVRSEIAIAATPLAVVGDRAFAINPSGTEVVIVGTTDNQAPALFRRRLASDHAEPITGSERAIGPFFSPDGEWLAFLQDGRLKKMPAGGGGAIDLGDAGDAQGGTFLPDGSVVFNVNHGEGLFRVNVSDGDRTVLTTVDHDKGEAGHHWPHALPGGTHVLFTTEVAGKPYSEARIELLTLGSGERRVLIEGGTDARYVASGHLLYWREGEVWRVPFDLSRLQLAGPGTVVLRDVAVLQANGHALFSVAGNGTLVYVMGRDPREERRLVLLDRAGGARPLPTDRRAFETVAISPDGRRVAATIVAANDSIWITPIDRAALTRITFDAENSTPVWAPDGLRIAFTRHLGGEARRLFVVPADGGGAPELIRDSGGRHEVSESWSPAGMIAFVRIEPTGSDIWVVNVDGERIARPFATTRFDETSPRFSPDGKWIAYVSAESGRREVYARAFPGPGPAHLVSDGGGNAPRWRRDGRELFYRKGDEVVVVGVTPGPDLTLAEPRVLFKGVDRPPTQFDWGRWDVMPDGQGFLMIQDFARPRTTLSLVQNWFEEWPKP